MNSNKTKKNSGITLIALVITIIVMLILVAVTITMAVNGGLFEYAQNAGTQTNGAIANEQLLAGGKITIGDTTYNSIDEYLGNANEPEGPIQIKLSIAGTKVTNVPLPSADFEHVEGTEINTGYVIRHKTDENEFVWVPVDKNQKITLEVKSDKDIEEIIFIDPWGDTKFTIENDDVTTEYKNTNIEPTINGAYIAQVRTEDGVFEKTLTVKSLYAIDSANDMMLSDEFWLMVSEGQMNKEAFWQVQAGELDLNTFVQQQGCNTLDQFLTVMFGQQMKTSYEEYSDIEEDENNKESDSVAEHGGFYIARYEAGTNPAKPRTEENNKDELEEVSYIIQEYGKPVSQKGFAPYNYVTYDQALGLAKSMYTSSEFSVSLLTGTAWDRTLSWLNETKNKRTIEVKNDSTSWGNYKNAKFDLSEGKYYDSTNKEYKNISGIQNKKSENTGVLLTTGAAPERNVANNIFDLAGNVWEWTNESFSSGDRVSRGGDFGSYGNGSYYPAASRFGYYPDTNFELIGFRSALYLK